MTLPTVVGVGTVAAGTGDVVPTLPSFAVDDIAWIVVEQSPVNNFPSSSGYPSGYDLVPNSQQKPASNATDGNTTVYWRRLQSGDTDPTVPDTINHTSARIIVTRGSPTTGNPWDVTNGGTDNTSTNALSVTGNTTTVDDCLILIFAGTGTDTDSTAEWSTPVNIDLANLTERMDNYNSNGNGGGFCCYTGEKAAAGAYGATTLVIATAGTKAFCTIAVKPATASTVKQLAALGVG